MKLKYNEIWAEEVLKHSNNEDISRDETMRLIELIDMAECTEDVKVIRVLFLALEAEDLGGVEETIFGILSTVDYKDYYLALFELIPQILQSNDPDLAVYLLSMKSGDQFTPKEWNTIKQLITKYLNNEVIRELLKLMENNKYFDLDTGDYPFPEFYQLFKKLLKEKSE